MDEAVLRFRQWRRSAQVILISTLFNEIGIDTIVSTSLCCLAWFELYTVKYLLIRILVSFFLELMSFINVYIFYFVWMLGYMRAVNLLVYSYFVAFLYVTLMNLVQMLLECNLEVCKSYLVLRIEFNDALKDI